MKFGIVILFLLISNVTLATDTLKFGRSYSFYEQPMYFEVYDNEHTFLVQLLKFNLLSL